MVRYTILSGIGLNQAQTPETEEDTIPFSKAGRLSKWKCDKLESFSDFIFTYQPPRRQAQHCYIELFSGPGKSDCNGADCYLEDSALRVFQKPGKFSSYGFLTRSRSQAGQLAGVLEPYSADNVRILSGNPNNEKALARLLDVAPRSASGIAFIDPGGYRKLDWSTLEKLAEHGKNWQGEKFDLLIIFPLEMSLLRNMMRPECQKSVTRFYGNHRWEEIKAQRKVKNWGPEDIKSRLVELYKAGLFGLGYHYVEDYKPASPTREPYYYLIYASDTASRLKDLRAAWGKSRFLKCELLYAARSKNN
jgi:three-Cys-motif partner protein